MAQTVHLVVVIACFEGGTAQEIASAFMADERTATVWIHADGGRSSRVALDVAAPSWEQATATAEQVVRDIAQDTGSAAEIVSVGHPAPEARHFEEAP